MLKGLGNLANLQGIVRQALDVKNRIEEVKDALGKERIEAEAGGGMVKVVMTGKFEVLSVTIEREIIDPNEGEMLETLVAAALNEAVRKTHDLVKAKMTEIAGGLEIPGLA